MSEKQQDAVELSHHLSSLSRARADSPLKSLVRFMKPGILSLAGGMPNPAYFPFSSLSAEILVSDSFPLSDDSGSSFSWLWKLFGSGSERTSTVKVNKFSKPGELNLATALQYGMATGLPDLQRIFKEFTTKVFQPGYSNFTTLVHAGNTDGIQKAFMTLCNPGEAIICSEWTYPSTVAAIVPANIEPIPIAMDSEGMRADALRATLSEWNEELRGRPRPHVMYTVPIGQNPTGRTMHGKRKREIYAICVEYDIIIIEDDPYFFLQQDLYVPKEHRANRTPDDDDERFIASLAPSYLKFDYQGRVIRLDTCSKTIAPGSRLGWFTCNPIFAERLERQGEVSTQAPCGFGQVMVTSLLMSWQYTGYMRWLKALRVQYTQRRDYFLDCLIDNFDLSVFPATEGYREGCDVYHASFKTKGFSRRLSEKPSPTIFSFVPPNAGMFVWLKLHLENHPSFASIGYKQLEIKLWEKIADAGVLFAPGFMFHADIVTDETPGSGHFRISFSSASFDEMKKATSIFAKVLNKFMNEAL
ncbi:pyridoxal phosphate-dependent transferase [Mycena floridula]|nr:pyridoxal phosphate-dependent transferase [Mycena floridula]